VFYGGFYRFGKEKPQIVFVLIRGFVLFYSSNHHINIIVERKNISDIIDSSFLK